VEVVVLVVTLPLPPRAGIEDDETVAGRGHAHANLALNPTCGKPPNEL